LRFLLFVAIAGGLCYGGWTFFDPDRGQDPVGAVKAALLHATNTADLSDRVDHALKLGLVDEAVMYADTARFAGVALRPDTQTALANETTNARKLMRGTGDFINGFFSREEITPAGLAGEVTADVAFGGDTADIAEEAAKMRVGIDYDELLLSLALAGAAFNGEASESVGGVLPARTDLSVLKVAKRAGLLTPEFTRNLLALLRPAVDMPRFRIAIHDIELTDRGALKPAVADYAKTVPTTAIAPELAKLGVLRKAAGTGETILLLHEVRSTDELAELARMSTVLGTKARAVIAITGKKSLRLFGNGPDLIAMVKGNPISFGAWAGALICLIAGWVAMRRASSAY
jgi:hypothetical protein